MIHFGVDPARFALTPALAEQAAAWRNRYPGQALILFVGRLRHYKGVNVLIEAMRSVTGAAGADRRRRPAGGGVAPAGDRRRPCGPRDISRRTAGCSSAGGLPRRRSVCTPLDEPRRNLWRIVQIEAITGLR